MTQTAGKRRDESQIHAAPRHRQDSRSAAVAQIHMPGEHAGDLNRRGPYENQFGIDAIFRKKPLLLCDPKRSNRGLHCGITDDQFRAVLRGAARLASGVVKPTAQREMRGDLERLKELAEA